MTTIEDRLNSLESEVAVLRQRIARESDWVTRVSGSLRDYPEFDDVLRLGREARELDNSPEATDGR